MKTKALSLLAIAMLTSLIAYSQATNLNGPDLGNKTFGSTIGTSVDYSANLFDGTLDVSIPILNYSLGGINSGISLSYKTSGIKIDNTAGSNGLGWNLNAEGYIVRDRRGFDDDVILSNGLSTPFTMIGSWLVAANASIPADEKELDDEVDEFTAVFNNRVIRFYISKTGAVFMAPRANIRIDRLVNGNVITNYNIYHGDGLCFRITDESGNEFYFVWGETEQKGYTIIRGNTSNFVNYNSIQKWVLDKVIASDGKQIKFSYNAKTISYDAYLSGSVTEKFTGNAFENDIKTWHGTVKQISSVTYPNNVKINFEYDNIPRCDLPDLTALKRISVVFSSANNLFTDQINYDFTYSYFYAADRSPFETVRAYDNCHGSASRYRLKLDKITKVGRNNVSEPYYTFSYNTSVSLPPRLSEQKDLYGYANGHIPLPYTQSGNTFYWAIPQHTELNGNQIYGQDLSPDITFKAAAVLNKITNGLGASFEIFYKEHTLYTVAGYPNTDMYDANDGPVYGLNYSDGLCLDYTLEKDGFNTDNTIRTNYTFYDGQLFLPGGKFSYANIQALDNPFIVKERRYFNSMMSKQDLVSGSNHGYTYATVQKINVATGRQILKQQKQFTNLRYEENGVYKYRYVDNPTYQQRSDHLRSPFSSRQRIKIWEVGLPLALDIKDENNELTARTSYTYIYNTYQAPDDFKSRKGLFWLLLAPDGNSGGEQSETYKPISGNALIVQDKRTTYQNATTFMVQQTDKVYDAKDNVKATKTSNSKGEQIETTYYYNYDFSFPSGTLYYLNLANVEKLLLTETVKRINTNTVHLLDASLQGIKYLNGRFVDEALYRSITDMPMLPAAFYGLSSAGPSLAAMRQQVINNASNNSPNIEGFIKSTKILSFDDKANPNEVVTDNETSANQSIIWDNVKGQKIATATNAAYRDIAYTGFEGSYTDFGVPDFNKGNWKFNKQNINTAIGFTGTCSFSLQPYLNGGVYSTNTLVAGEKYVLSFWASGVGSVSAMNGSTSVTLAIRGTKNGWRYYEGVMLGSNNPVGITGNVVVDEIRLYPEKASMYTFSYTPSGTISTTCDERNKLTFYEYDDMGRYKLKRDQNRNIIERIQNNIQKTDN